MADIDPLSQLIGTLSAQVSTLSSNLIDLRSEIVTNRNDNNKRWDEIRMDLDKVYAEYRNVKHIEQNLQMSGQAIGEKLAKLDQRLRSIEDLVLVWRARVLILVGAAAAIGMLIPPLVQVAANYLLR